MSKSRDILVFGHQGIAKKFCLFSVVKMVKFYKSFALHFWPHLSNAVMILHQNDQFDTAITDMALPTMACYDDSHEIQLLIILFCLYSFVLDFCLLKMCKITKCVCMLEIGFLYAYLYMLIMNFSFIFWRFDVHK